MLSSHDGIFILQSVRPDPGSLKPLCVCEAYYSEMITARTAMVAADVECEGYDCTMVRDIGA